jgi:hypothetical protein
MSNQGRIAVLVGIIVVAVGALLIAKGGSDNNSSSVSTTTPATSSTTGATTGTTTTTTAAPKPAGPPVFTVVVKNAKPAGGIKKIKVNKGDRLVIVVKSDTADEIHVHGYDFMKDVNAGGSVRFPFKATIDGSFEIELEGRKQQIAQLTVEP